MPGPAPVDLPAVIAAIEDDLDHERYRAAIARAGALDLDALDGDGWETVVHLALRCRVYAGGAADQIAVDARRALARAGGGEPRAQLHAQIAYALTAKRCERLALVDAEAAEAAAPASSLGPAVRGWIAMHFDRRDDAELAYREATARAEPHRGWMGLARVRYIVGDFDGALAALRELGEHPRTRVGALRLRADVARVRGDWPAFLDLVDQILAATPGGDQHRADLLDRASALCALGRRDAGVDVYRAMWRDDAADAAGKYARAVLDVVERDGGQARRVMLPKFPTVSQKRNYCGPASLELVLRSLGIDVDQDDIAPAVKRDTGSSILAMTRYLESHGLQTRRFEGDGPRLGACIALGLPVIVEEEYSTTSHVAVVIGVDEGLGLLYVQDPMTHVTSERLIRTQGALGAMYRGAAIVAVRADDAARVAALDAAGVVDQEHLRIIDSCAEDGLTQDTEELLRRCDRALALVEDYPLAWYRRLQALWSQALRFRTGNNLSRHVVELRRARVRYHDQEWPHVMHAAYLMNDGRHEEALIELEHALRCDPHDSNTAQDIAECHMAQGRRDEATAAFWKALTIDPTHVRATENFAAHALDGGELPLAAHLSACALELAPGNPFNHLTASRVAQAEARRDDALAHARRCVEVQPGYVHGHLHLASLLTTTPDDAAQGEALAIYSELSRRHPYWFEPRWRAARRLERDGKVGEAVDLLLAGLEIAQDDPVDLVRPLTEILLEAGDEAGAVEMAERFARERPTVGLLEVLWDTLHAAERYDRARASTAEFLAANDQSPFACAQHAFRLLGRGAEADAEAERLLRHAVAGSPTFHWARRLLADLLARDRLDEALAVLASAPGGDVGNRLAHASLLADHGRGDDARAVLAELAIDDGWSQDVWTRAWLADDAVEVALARLTAGGGAGADAPAHHRRTRLALELAAERYADAERTLATLPDDDAITHDVLVWACDADDRFRPALRARLGAALAAPATAHARRRYLRAILDGDAAAAGDRGPLDARLAHERNAARVMEAMYTLSQERHRDLVLDIRDALAAHTGRSCGLVEAARGAAMRGDHATAIARARACLDAFPDARDAMATLAIELAMTGDEAGAADAALRAASYPSPTPIVLEAAALARLFAGERDAARALAATAARQMAAAGFARDVLPILAAVRAALAGDGAAIARLRGLPGLHLDPAAPMWDRLIALAGAAP